MQTNIITQRAATEKRVTVIIVLGNSDPEIAKKRVDLAVRAWGVPRHRNADGTWNAYILFSGGAGTNIGRAGEATMMRKMAARVPEEYCMYEGESRTTVENLNYSREVIKEKLGNVKKHIIVCTSSFHIVRAKVIALDVFPGYMPYNPSDTEINTISFRHTEETVTEIQYTSESRLLWMYSASKLKVLTSTEPPTPAQVAHMVLT